MKKFKAQTCAKIKNRYGKKVAGKVKIDITL